MKTSIKLRKRSFKDHYACWCIPLNIPVSSYATWSGAQHCYFPWKHNNWPIGFQIFFQQRAWKQLQWRPLFVAFLIPYVTRMVQRVCYNNKPLRIIDFWIISLHLTMLWRMGPIHFFFCNIQAWVTTINKIHVLISKPHFISIRNLCYT